mmetsp:Transcript_13724/g.24878  ORF Transcript_13724/g.24878 Transcript_13724/m.24878 type:complete len:410 (+) Transcript_13724:105-1334(+)|eukprot:CAMPEP_0201629742 /NCGR_PEP_ID=MMETSP0493-20130528/4304_1 /ASSEMBLY_ACC=CAM_ASM_000838 /TAXON_ID=420259 /ORGANISM="Thalassiosira gravida, Strain GMp14c1" /LENGTH=409 /DNA_ID=CAMNT_0048100783 /DNA_START=69 /DNA_END=1298 /DNA_ORIENTATION=+
MNNYQYYRPITKIAIDPPSQSQRTNRLSSGYAKDRMKQEEEYEAIANADLEEDDLSEILLKMSEVALQAKYENTTKAKGPAPTFTLLHSLPGYTIGDTLRSEDKILCYSKDDATSTSTFAIMNNLRPNDCAFVLRSDGSFTYSIFDGHAYGDASMSFRVDERGNFKVIPVSHVASMVKVPTLRRRDDKVNSRHSPRARARAGTAAVAVRHQHSRSLTVARKTRVPTSEARTNREPMISSSLPPIKITTEVNSENKDGTAKLFSTHKSGGGGPTTMMPQTLTSGRVGRRYRRATGASRDSVHPNLTTLMSITLSSSLPPMNTVTTVEIKTQDGKIKTVPMYKPGMDVLYYSKGPVITMDDNTALMSPARVIDIHLSNKNLLGPSYTIRLMDGQEIKADNDDIAHERLFAY